MTDWLPASFSRVSLAGKRLSPIYKVYPRVTLTNTPWTQVPGAQAPHSSNLCNPYLLAPPWAQAPSWPWAPEAASCLSRIGQCEPHVPCSAGHKQEPRDLLQPDKHPTAGRMPGSTNWTLPISPWRTL